MSDAKLIKNVPMDAGYYPCYDCSLHAILDHWGGYYPRWYLSSVAGFHNTFEYLNISQEGERFITFNFAGLILDEILFALEVLGYGFDHIHGTSWEDAWSTLRSFLDEEIPVLVGPLDFYYLDYVNPEERPNLPRLSDHYAVAVGYSEKEIFLNDTYGYHYTPLDLNNFRQAWGSLVWNYMLGENEEAAKDKYIYSMICVDGKRKGKSKGEIIREVIKKTASSFMNDMDITSISQDGYYYRGVLGENKLSEELSAHYETQDKIWMDKSISFMYNFKTKWGNQCRAEMAVFLNYVKSTLPDYSDELDQLSGVFRTSSILWLDFHRQLSVILDTVEEDRWEEECQKAATIMSSIASQDKKAREKLKALARKLNNL